MGEYRTWKPGASWVPKRGSCVLGYPQCWMDFVQSFQSNGRPCKAQNSNKTHWSGAEVAPVSSHERSIALLCERTGRTGRTRPGSEAPLCAARSSHVGHQSWLILRSCSIPSLELCAWRMPYTPDLCLFTVFSFSYYNELSL